MRAARFTAALLVVMGLGRLALAQRVLGLDVSAWQSHISQSQWESIYSVDDRKFVFIRSSRGGTTGEDHRQGGYPAGDNSFFNLSQRYDDPYFIQNITRATDTGLLAGPYHFARLDVIASTANTGGIANTGADEATHFVQMAGAFMRPGYLMPTYDLEAGETQRSANDIAQFSIDFSNQVYTLTGIRPAIYINGNYSNILQQASFALRSQLAQPPGLQPSVVSPAYSMLWNARWAGSGNIQNGNPRDTASTFYGPWDDYGDFNPWDFWQYTSSGSVTGISPVDLNVARGDIEYVKDFLVPAVWMNDTSGDWATLSNWNSGQPVVAPVSAPGQLTPFATGPLPVPRLPGVAGSGPAVTSGLDDTVILERPNANITITHSSGSHDVRKLYVREALNITGGSLTVNYDPDYAVPTDEFGFPLFFNARRSGPISAQFSAPVTLSGSGSFDVKTLHVDAGQTFTIDGGSLSFRRIDLGSGYPPARMVLNTGLAVDPASVGGTAYIRNSYNYSFGELGAIDLNGGNRTISVAAGGELFVDANITNGALTKSGAGAMRLMTYNNYGATTVAAGTLIVNGSTGSGTLNVGGANAKLAGYGYIPGDVVASAGGAVAPGDGYGSLYIAGNTSFNAGSTFEYEFDDPDTYSADTLNVLGNLNIAGNPSLNLVATLDSLLPRNTRYALVSYGGAWNGSAFAGYANNSIFTLGGNVLRIQYDDDAFDTVNYGYFSNAVTLTTLNGPVAGFRDEYSPDNWLLEDANARGGYVYTGNAPYEITIVGPNDLSRLPGEIAYSIELPASGTLSFDWSFFNEDIPGYDFAFFINGTETSLAGANAESGHVEVAVLAGDILGWRITSADSVGGAGVLSIFNFRAPGIPIDVPEPAAAALLAAALPLLTRRRRVR